MTEPLPEPRPRVDRTVQLLLGAAVVVQVLVALRALGWWHPDSQFGIFEFAGWKLGLTPAEALPFEFPHRVRQTVPVWGYLGFHELMQALHLDQVYVEQTVLRLCTSLANLALFNAIILNAFRSDRRLTLYAVLFVANFSWSLPYVRTLYCYENLGGLFYFGAVFLYVRARPRGVGLLPALLVGFLLGMSFFFRFQMGFAMVGFAVWLVFFDRASLRTWTALVLGFLVATGLNVGLDSLFYGDWTFTPWNYWRVNIVESRAARFGSSSVLYYLGILAVVFTAPILSIVLLGYFARGLVRGIKNPYILSVLTFLAVHFLVGHKEERFLFPVFGILPVVLGFGLRDRLKRLPTTREGIRAALPVKSVILPSLAINGVLLVATFLFPVCQQIEFTRRLDARFGDGPSVQLVCYRQMPYETGAGNVANYYLRARGENIDVRVLRTREEFLEATRDPAADTYFVCTFKRLVKHDLLGELAWTPLVASSEPLFALARRIHEVTGWAVPEMWVLFRYEPPAEDPPGR